MRPFILVAFGLQVIFGTTCMMQTASAQELPAAPLMSVAPSRATANPHAGCHPKKEWQEPQQENERQNGDLPCLGHCLSQATNRAVSDTGVQVPCTAMTAPTLTFSPTFVCGAITPCVSVFPTALSPPGTETVVLRQ